MRITYWRDRRTQKERKMERALIPFYHFVELHNLSDYYAVLDVEGVVSILGQWEWGMSSTGRVPEEWVGALRDAGPIIEGKKLPFRKNDKIRILAGALAGYVGVIEREQGKHSFRVGMESGLEVTIQVVDMERVPQ
jgi:transcription antitermination factor NusG